MGFDEGGESVKTSVICCWKKEDTHTQHNQLHPALAGLRLESILPQSVAQGNEICF